MAAGWYVCLIRPLRIGEVIGFRPKFHAVDEGSAPSGTRLVAKSCGAYSTDGCRSAVNVTDDQKHGCPHETDQPEDALHASSTQDGEDRNRCGQAEHHD
jgi:hypothetical protein